MRPLCGDRRAHPLAGAQPDISAVVQLLEDSIEAQGYAIETPGGPESLVDLSTIGFDALRQKFARAQKHIEAEKLRGALNSRLGAAGHGDSTTARRRPPPRA